MEKKYYKDSLKYICVADGTKLRRDVRADIKALIQKAKSEGDEKKLTKVIKKSNLIEMNKEKLISELTNETEHEDKALDLETIMEVLAGVGLYLVKPSAFGDVTQDYILLSDERFETTFGNDVVKMVALKNDNVYRSVLGEINRRKDALGEPLFSCSYGEFMTALNTMPAMMTVVDPSKETFFEDKHKYFNIWKNPLYADGDAVNLMLLEKLDNPFEDIIKSFLLHMCGTEDGVDWLLNLLSSHYNLKDTVYGSAMFTGANGTGKSVLPNWLGAIYTDGHYTVGSSTANVLVSSDNASLETALVYFLDEVKMDEELYTGFKNLVGNRMISFKKLNKDVTNIRNRTLFLISNNIPVGGIPFKLEDGYSERRLTVFENFTTLKEWSVKAGAELNLDPDYLFDLVNLSNVAEEDIRWLLITFAGMLANYDYDIKRTQKPFNTPVRERMIKAGMDQITALLEAYKNKDKDWFALYDGATFDAGNGYQRSLSDYFEDVYAGKIGFRTSIISNIAKDLFGMSSNKSKSLGLGERVHAIGLEIKRDQHNKNVIVFADESTATETTTTAEKSLPPAPPAPAPEIASTASTPSPPAPPAPETAETVPETDTLTEEELSDLEEILKAPEAPPAPPAATETSLPTPPPQEGI